MTYAIDHPNGTTRDFGRETTRYLLVEARRILTPDGAWTQDCAARDARAHPVPPAADAAVCWSLDGALWLATDPPPVAHHRHTLIGRVERALYPLIHTGGPAVLHSWNDAHTRTQAEVLALLDRAIDQRAA